MIHTFAIFLYFFFNKFASSFFYGWPPRLREELDRLGRFDAIRNIRLVPPRLAINSRIFVVVNDRHMATGLLPK